MACTRGELSLSERALAEALARTTHVTLAGATDKPALRLETLRVVGFSIWVSKHPPLATTILSDFL